MAGKILTMAETSSEGLTGPEGPTAKVTQVVVGRAQFFGSENRAYFTLDPGSILVWDAVLIYLSIFGFLSTFRNETNQCLVRLTANVCLFQGFENAQKLLDLLNAPFICPVV